MSIAVHFSECQIFFNHWNHDVLWLQPPLGLAHCFVTHSVPSGHSIRHLGLPHGKSPSASKQLLAKRMKVIRREILFLNMIQCCPYIDWWTLIYYNTIKKYHLNKHFIYIEKQSFKTSKAPKTIEDTLEK